MARAFVLCYAAAMDIELRAYLWTLGALVFVFTITMVIAAAFPHLAGKLEMFGLGTVTGGLIGLLRAPRFAGNQRSAPEMPPGGARKPAEREKEG